MIANRAAAMMLPNATLFWPAEPVLRTVVGVDVAEMVPFVLLVTANVVLAGTGTVVTPALTLAGAPVTRTGSAEEVPVRVWNTT